MLYNKKIILVFLAIVSSLQGLSKEINYIKPVEQLEQISQSDNDEDKVLEEIYRSSGRLYHKLVELAALYYCGSAKVVQDRIIVDIGRDMVFIVKSLALYIPVLLKNPKLSKKVKLKKSLYVVGAITTLGFLIKEIYQGYSGSPLPGGRNYMIDQGHYGMQGQGYYGMQFDYSPYNATCNYQPSVGCRPSASGYRK